MTEVKIPYQPRFAHIHKELETCRFSVLVAHRRFGKTVLAINHLIKMALLCDKPRGCYGYVGPLKNQAKKVAWGYLKHYTANVPYRKVDETELRIDLPNGASIWIYGADNPDSIRGSYFDGVIMDEVAQMKAEVWGEIVQPMLADRAGWAVFIGTPKGVNLFSELYYQALERQQKNDPNWRAMMYPVTATDVLPASEVARLKKDMSENAFRQEMLCDFAASSDNNLLNADEVREAMTRQPDMEVIDRYPLVIGVDVARFGDDATVFFPRRGRYAYEPKIFQGLSNVEVAHQLAAFCDERQPRMVCIDQGQGTGVIDLAREILALTRIEVIEVPFGSRANNAEAYVNRRSEMWALMRDWIRDGGILPNQQALLAELTAPRYSFDVQGRIKLEAKDLIKERLGGKSTDLADALALTFAVPAPSNIAEEWEEMWRPKKRAYDPFREQKRFAYGN